MLIAGLRPLEPYAQANAPWLCHCLGCDSIVTPTYSRVQQSGRGCGNCRRNLALPGREMVIYLMSHDEYHAVKIGVALSCHGRIERLQQHEKYGWQSYALWRGLNQARLAYGVESEVVASWRANSIEPALTAKEMPRGGWTETAAADLVNLEDLTGYITHTIGQVADRLLLETEILSAI